MNAIQRFFFNIFLFCFGLGLLFFVKLDSYASSTVNIKFLSRTNYSHAYGADYTFSIPDGGRVCVYASTPVDSVWHSEDGTYSQNVYVFCNTSDDFYVSNNSYNNLTSLSSSYNYFRGSNRVSASLYVSPMFNSNFNMTYLPIGYYSNCFPCYVNDDLYSLNVVGCPVFSSLDDARAYIDNGVLPSLPYDESLSLDSFKVTSWSIGNLQALFKSKFDVRWSDPRITVVQVRITGTANEATYEGSSSPFKGKFQADQFVFNNGDVIHLVATPYKADGSYGTSLYYSVTYSDDIPFSNTYRKLVNNNNNDNTLIIPYSGASGNDSVTLPVDGVTTNVTYKVNYNPVTNEYGDLNIYEINYNPIIVYPSDTPEEVIDETQDTVINEYNTNNYYETTKNINLNFDIDFGDISSNDIGEGFNGVSGFFNGFGGFIGRLSNWILALFPFLSPIVASSIVFMFGLVILIAGIALILKIIGAVGNIIDAILPL